MPEAFPNLVVAELQRRNLLPSGRKKPTYIIECTPHGTERMLIYDRHPQPEMVCYWASGKRFCRLKNSAQLICDLTSDHPSLRPLLTEILAAEEIDSRFVVAIPWYQGTMLSSTFGSDSRRIQALDLAFGALMVLHKATLLPHRFDEQNFREYVERSITILGGSAVIPRKQRERLILMESELRTLIGEDVPTCVLHGDFEFGNLLQEYNGGIRVLDWELSRRCGISFIDLAHLLIRFGIKGLELSHYASTIHVFGVQRTFQTWSAPYLHRYMAEIGIEHRAIRKLAALTILNDAANYLVRVPFLRDANFWADYIDAADWLLSAKA